MDGPTDRTPNEAAGDAPTPDRTPGGDRPAADTAPAAGPDASPGRVPDTVYCVGCEYDLCGLRTDANCPECGTPVAETFRKNLLSGAEFATLRRMRSGLSLLLNGILLWFAVAIMAAVANFVAQTGMVFPGGSMTSNPFGRGYVLTQSIGTVVSTIVGLVVMLGFWRFASPDPIGTEAPGTATPGSQGPRSRKVLRVATAAYAVVLVLSTATSIVVVAQTSQAMIQVIQSAQAARAQAQAQASQAQARAQARLSGAASPDANAADAAPDEVAPAADRAPAAPLSSPPDHSADSAAGDASGAQPAEDASAAATPGSPDAAAPTTGTPPDQTPPPTPSTVTAAPMFSPAMLIAMAFGTLLSLLGLGAVGTMFFSSMLYVRGLALRIPDLKIHRLAKTRIIACPLWATVGLLALGLGPLVAVVLYWNLLNMLHKRVKQIARDRARGMARGGGPAPTPA